MDLALAGVGSQVRSPLLVGDAACDGKPRPGLLGSNRTKRSKMRSWCGWGTPGPSSATIAWTYPSRLRSGTSIRPVGPMAARALSMSLRRSRPSALASAASRPARPPRVDCEALAPPPRLPGRTVTGGRHSLALPARPERPTGRADWLSARGRARGCPPGNRRSELEARAEAVVTQRRHFDRQPGRCAGPTRRAGVKGGRKALP